MIQKLQTDLHRRTQRVLAHASVVVAINPMHIWVGLYKALEVYQADRLGSTCADVLECALEGG